MKTFAFLALAAQVAVLAFSAPAQADGNWVSVDSAIAKCEARASLYYNVKTKARVVRIANGGCSYAKIDTMTQQSRTALKPGQSLNIDVSSIEGDSIPLELSGSFMELSMAKIAQIEGELATQRGNRAKNAAAGAAVGTAVAVGTGVVIVKAAEQGER